jgi:DEAD/DEAH box helicase domain-containing protein
MARDIVYSDLETQRTANDVGGWGNKDKMGMSIGCTFSTKTGQYHIFPESGVQALIDQLRRADLVVGFNHINFDYAVLMGYTVLDLQEQLLSFDIMVDLEKKLGHRLKLEAVASATLGTGKTADGLDAIRWWQQGKIAEIAEYCCYDVKVTMRVHEYGVKHGHVKYHDRNGREQRVEVDWKL